MRELRAILREEGYQSRPGRGSHEVWVHPQAPRQRIVLAGNGGQDAHRYQVGRMRKYHRGMMVNQ